VADQSFTDATLVLAGHGSTLNADSAAPTHQHADEFRRRKIFGQVLVTFWKEEPSFAAVLRGAFGRRVFIVPLFISDGYFTEQVIPRELGFCANDQIDFDRVRRRGEQTLFYCEPVGTHPGMTSVLLARADQVAKQFPFPREPKPSETALFIAGHGTGNNENSRKAIERQVDLLRELKRYFEVHPIFMEEEPRVGDCYEMTSAKSLIIVPFFISDGLHSYEDIPVMLGEAEPVVQKRFKAGQPTWRNPTEKKGKRVWYAPSVGSDPGMAEVILERVTESASIQ
jgi:sirohydrochlorin cobaltochelatase